MTNPPGRLNTKHPSPWPSPRLHSFLKTGRGEGTKQAAQGLTNPNYDPKAGFPRGGQAKNNKKEPGQGKKKGPSNSEK